MLNTEAKLRTDVFEEKVERKPTRDGFGTGVVEAGKKNSSVVVLSADLKESTRAEWFEKEFPERYIEMGVAEQNMATVAAGLAAVGKIPFITSYAAFSPGRNYEQIRTTIALNDVPVKVCGMHAGVSVGPDGATHQMLEDIAMMRALPNMIVINPTDAVEAHKAIVASAENGVPTYIRFGRAPTPIITTEESPFAIGKALLLWEGSGARVAICTTGALAHEALLAARALTAEGLEVLVASFPTISPLDEAVLYAIAKRVEKIVTVEEHQTVGGFGGAVAEYVSAVHPVYVERLGIQHQFGQSGEPQELIAHYGLDAAHIISAVRAPRS